MQFPFIDIVVIGIPLLSIFEPKLADCGEQEFIVDMETQGIEFMEYVAVMGDMVFAVETMVVASEYNF